MNCQWEMPNQALTLNYLISLMYVPTSPILTLKLFNKYAKKFRLFESQLAILHCAGHNDPALVRKLWELIVKNGMQFM